MRDVLSKAHPQDEDARKAALERAKPFLEDVEIRLWPFPTTEPAVGGLTDETPATTLAAAFAAARRGGAEDQLRLAELLEAEPDLINQVSSWSIDGTISI